MHNHIDDGARLLSLGDWNDARLVLATVRTGSFSAAAQALGLDQATVSRRIASLEASARRPLFHRRRTGAQPTPAGLALADIAERMAIEAETFEQALAALHRTVDLSVTVAASEGIISYVLAPALLHGTVGPLSTTASSPPMTLPSLTFVGEERAIDAHITVLTLAPGEVPSGRSAIRVRRVGSMKFVPVAASSYLDVNGSPDSFEDIKNFDILNHSRYRFDKGLDPWNDLLARNGIQPALSVDTTSALHIPLISGCGIALLPDYSPIFDPSVIVLDVATPPMAIELWLAAHEDSLREPAVRTVYDAVAQMFLSSRWFR